MWCPTQACSPAARQNVDFCSAPQASRGRSVAIGSVSVEGTYPRERRSIIVRRPAGRRDRAQHGVVGARLDRPVVEQEQVGDRAQSLERVLVGERDRIVGDVPARHHQRVDAVAGEPRQIVEQQVVQRRRGEHHAELGQAGGDRRTRRRSRPRRSPRGEHDRPGRARQQRLVLRARAPRAVRAAATDPTSSANGLSSRCLRDRSAATARSLRASQARWNPPTDLTATICAHAQALRDELDRVARARRGR